MDFINLFAIILALSGIFSYINQRFIKLPTAIGLMLLGLVLSLLLQLASFVFPGVLTTSVAIIKSFDFSSILLDFMLSYLLFAGALHTDWNKVKKEKSAILAFATMGVVISTSIIATGLYGLGKLFEFPLPYVHCLLFGALISPTDPIAVLSILKKSNVD